MKRILSALSAGTILFGAFAAANGCSSGSFVLGADDAGTGSDSGSSISGSSSGSGTSGMSSTGSSSGTVSAGTSSGAPGSGSGSAGGSGNPASGSSAGTSSGGTQCGGVTCAGQCCSHADRCCNQVPYCFPGSVCPMIGILCIPAADCKPPPTDAGASTLRWYRTCGYPVCAAGPGPVCGTPGGIPCYTSDAGTPCPAVGSSCSVKGATCGAPSASNCGSIEVCDDHDPRGGPGGCPISSAKFKNDIHYVDENQLEQLHDETMQVRLATYNYQGQYGDPDVKHLGFIIEDNPQSFAVDRGHDRVDLYGYLSMVVAAMQVQEKEIADLRRQLDEARVGVCSGAPR